MASVVLANRNEPNWTQAQPRGGANFMGKVPFSNSNPNPNPKLSKKRQLQAQLLPDVDESPTITQSAASDDASSINHRRAHEFSTGGYVTFNIAAYSKKELLELKSRLVADLEQIRQLKNRIELSSEFQIRSGSKKKPITATANNSSSNNNKVLGNKRPFQATSFVAAAKERRDNPENEQLLKKCGQILTKLMKNKRGYIFNTPVDVVGLQLHDYYDVIKKPMDLGSVKAKLGKRLYVSPGDFAADVRLTFNNAMKYNPKGHEVYVLAELLLSRFKELYRPIEEKLGHDEEDEMEDQLQVQEVQASSWDYHNKKKNNENSLQAGVEKPEQALLSTAAVNQNPNPQSTAQLPVRTPSPAVRAPPVKPLKQPKPKAKDPNKREMSLEEKHKLGVGLQSLPSEKMDQVVQIIKKRNRDIRQEGDEIELDIEALDTETLWELDRFVTNYKKMVSKLKRQALMGTYNITASAVNEGNKDVPGNERMDAGTEAKKPKKGETGDEDVDIGDDMPMSSFPPVEIEKDTGHPSSSSSSSSSSSDDSSSSSDSDSGSSSGSDSEDAHS